MFSYDFMQNALFISICIAILCPCIGIFIVLKRYSMIGEVRWWLPFPSQPSH